jgi:DHA1 family bicyclomycin/chloramphenicol resistance-like MFS transporter
MAMARDLFEGDQMARIVTIVMAVFMIGPIFVPIVGELILAIAPWPAVFLVAMTMSIGVMGWTIWFGETLPVERRRPLEVRPLAQATGAVFSTRVTIGHILAQTFAGAAFFSFLGSSQPIIDRIYGREDQFVFFFGGGRLLMVLALLVNNRLITRYRARPMALATSAVLLTASVLGVITLAGGAGLGAVIDASIDDTVTPMAIGYVACGLATVAALRWAGDPES